MVQTYRPKADILLDAMQFVLGKTTKREILDFCPQASVGVLVTGDDVDGFDATDIRWVFLPEDIDVVYNGDWIVKGVTGKYFRRPDDEFTALYEPVP